MMNSRVHVNVHNKECGDSSSCESVFTITMVEEIDLPESQPMQGEERVDSSPPKKNNYFPDIKIKKHRTGVKISNDARESSAVSFFTLVSQRFQMIHASS